MNAYRLYLLDESGHFAKGQAFQAKDDLAALDFAMAFAVEHSVEVWQAKRCVAKLLKGGKAAPCDTAQGDSTQADANP